MSAGVLLLQDLSARAGWPHVSLLVKVGRRVPHQLVSAALSLGAGWAFVRRPCVHYGYHHDLALPR